jgi:UDP-glucose 4-epimerase
MKKTLTSHPVLRYRYALEMWKLAKLQRWASRHPFFSRWVKIDLDVLPEEADAVIIPVEETVQAGKSTVLPFQILQPIIEKAGGHMLLERCPCRNGERCSDYPRDFGCLFLGEAVRDVSARIGTQTDVDGAKAHVARALELGLVPMIVHARFDAALISVPFRKMLAVCFCCDCCCTVRHSMRLGPSSFDDTVQRLPGLRVEIGEACTACGSCHESCPVRAIGFQGSVSVIDQDSCKACGLCATVCPEGAPRLYLDDAVDVIEELMDRIRSRTEIGI